MKQDAYRYQVNGADVYLELDPDHVAVRFDEPSLKSTRASFVAANDHLGEFSERIEVPGEKFTVFKLAEVQRSRPQRFRAAMDALHEAPLVKNAQPVFRMGNKKVLVTDKLIVGLRTRSKPEKLWAKFGLEGLQASGNEWLVQVPPGEDVFALIGKMEKEEGVAYVEPNFVTIGPRTSLRPSAAPPEPQQEIRDDADLSAGQYALRITEAEKAWPLQKGSKKIRIAILDEGVDSLHPDLKDSIVSAYDAIDDDTYQEPHDWDAHGTACAGLAAARHNAFGVKGIAGGCSIMAIRLAYSERPRGEWVTSNWQISRAIEWAWTNGADVLSNSWGGGAPSNRINNAFEQARTRGRKGRGAVLVIAAGNENGAVQYPANLSTLLTVSASNEWDEPKTPRSRDGETWWGSCFGPEVDVAAPGVHNLTTDITGERGYNKEYNYTDFNGTSSATPIVAGVAALILSANPDLKESEVREIITATADKVGAVPYHRGHNDRMGYGRVNARKAVQEAKRRLQPQIRIRSRKLKSPKKGAPAGR